MPELSLQDIDAAIDKEMASPQVPYSCTSCLSPCMFCGCHKLSPGFMSEVAKSLDPLQLIVALLDFASALHVELCTL